MTKNPNSYFAFSFFTQIIVSKFLLCMVLDFLSSQLFKIQWDVALPCFLAMLSSFNI